jgi:diguanylate cyclase (GGDEF)-like protein
MDLFPALLSEPPSLLAIFLLFALLASVVLRGKTNNLRNALEQANRQASAQRQASQALSQRIESMEESNQELTRLIGDFPEIAQRLIGTREVRKVPDRVLELVQEFFSSSYSVFYKLAGDGGLIATNVHGESQFHVGHQVPAETGVVGLTAAKQIAFTPEDAVHESSATKLELAKSMGGTKWSICIPVLSDQCTLGVILVGPTGRNLPQLREVGRTIAVITSATITSALLLKQQSLLAKTDGLTGLLNKSHILERCNEQIANPGVSRRFSVFLFDIDKFKHFNDTNGHLPGDELLKSLSRLFKDTIRDSEFAGRYGGEEFLLLMPDSEKEEALRAAERIREQIANFDFPYGDRQPGGRVTVSGGVATWPHDGEDVDTLLRRADESLYQAKRSGRNRVIAYAPTNLGLGDSMDESIEYLEMDAIEIPKE